MRRRKITGIRCTCRKHCSRNSAERWKRELQGDREANEMSKCLMTPGTLGRGRMRQEQESDERLSGGKI
jgi:hypothetical protein